jgi:hypothetical protein
MSEATRTSVRVAAIATTNATTHAPLALSMKVEFVMGRDGEVAGTVIEWTAPTRPVIVALTG